MSREFHPGMGQAVAERTILRKIPVSEAKAYAVNPEDPNHDHIKLYCETYDLMFQTNTMANPHEVRWETWDDVAQRVAMGNAHLANEGEDYEKLYNAIAKATILMSGRHLQHGDRKQHTRNQEVFTNCATAAVSFLLFYLLLNGSGVGRLYDDDLMLVDWNYMPNVRCVIDESHADYNYLEHESVRDARHKYEQGTDCIWHTVEDSREGWAKAIEKIESMTFAKAFKDSLLILDFSPVRCKGSLIGGMQNRPSSGPAPLMAAIHKLVTLKGAGMPKWMQAMFVDHYLAEPVLVGGARRAARMAVKNWRDKTIFDFIQLKRPIEFKGKTPKQVVTLREDKNFMSFLWSSNNSVGVDQDFWKRVKMLPDHADYNSPLTRHARAVFDMVTECSYGDGTGEPAFLNLDQLVQKPEGLEKTIDGNFVGSKRYKVDNQTKILLSGLAGRAQDKKYKMIVNPCGEIALSFLGGFCVIADTVPYHADTLQEAEDACRLSARALIRVNLMDSIYGKEVKRTNRIGVGQTGVHEAAWKFFKVGFYELTDPDFKGYLARANQYDFTDDYIEVIERLMHEGVLDARQRAAAFWEWQGQMSRATMAEAMTYSEKLGIVCPHTMMTIKPAGTTSKLFGLSEGWHLPALAHYLRWVQFQADDALIDFYEEAGYPVRRILKSYIGQSIVGFPTVPVIGSLGIDDKLVLAGEATPVSQYKWLQLGEFFWIEGGSVADYVAQREPREGGERYGNQISYTLKYQPDVTSLKRFQDTLLQYQSDIRCCSVMPQEKGSSYEYLPEEAITKAKFEEIMKEIQIVVDEEIGREHVECEGGACPIDWVDKK